ncbi:MAG TPA: type II toxin-antitoxin system VapC family toxin [Chloroflexota bacterium]
MHHEASVSWFRNGLAPQAILAAPVLVLAEVAGAIARRTGNRSAVQNALDHMRASPQLRMVALDPTLALQAAYIGADLRIRGADACYVAVAVHLGMPLVTFDNELATRARAIVEVIRPS